MRMFAKAALALLAMSGVAAAEPFGEVTIGVPVPSIAEAEKWYASFFGPDVEVLHPVPGIAEFKAASGVWLQLFEAEGEQRSATIVRFLVDDMAAAQAALSERGIDSGEAIEVLEVVTFSEFADPYGNPLGLYDLP